MKYIVKFILFGKKMQTEVESRSIEYCKEIIKSKIEFVSIVNKPEPEVKSSEDKSVNDILNIFGMK